MRKKPHTLQAAISHLQRTAAKLSTAELSELAHLPYTTSLRFATEKSKPAPKVIDAVARAFGFEIRLIKTGASKDRPGVSKRAASHRPTVSKAA